MGADGREAGMVSNFSLFLPFGVVVARGVAIRSSDPNAMDARGVEGEPIGSAGDFLFGVVGSIIARWAFFGEAMAGTLSGDPMEGDATGETRLSTLSSVLSAM